ncbi:MAG: transmembrane 220 family protein [Phaeodactylibacter sp.]|uniref:transmembrane 220 family protein n=1 Tax=Phaeodactylibacter sp. TaxID=1940289 RepID=UPI0032ED5151
MKNGHLVVAALFLLFAYFQLNDPDPWGWVALYIGVSAVALLAFFRQPFRWLAIAGLGIIAIWGIQLFPAFLEWITMGTPSIAEEMKTDQPHIELAREFLGLMLCALVLGGYLIRGRKGWT